jgi:hypothetical protein
MSIAASPIASLPIAGREPTGGGGIADNLSTAAYVLTGISITDSLAISDDLATATYLISALDLNDVFTAGTTNYADDLLTATYSIAANSLNDVLAVNDNLSVASYAISALSLNDSYATNDSLSTAAYVINAPDITDVKTGAITYADDLLAASYAIAASAINDEFISVNSSSVFGGATHFAKLDEENRKRKAKKLEQIADLEAVEVEQPTKEATQPKKIVKKTIKAPIIQAPSVVQDIIDKQELSSAIRDEMIREYLIKIQAQRAQEEEETIVLMMMAMI